MYMLSNHIRIRNAQTRDFGIGSVRPHGMRRHFQAGRVCITL